MTTQQLTKETAEWLVGKTIIRVESNFIQLDNGLQIYLDDEEVEYLNSFNED